MLYWGKVKKLDSRTTVKQCPCRRLTPGHTPAFFLYSDWASGLIFLRTLYTHVIMPNGMNIGPEPVDPRKRGLYNLRLAIRHVQQVGVTNVSLVHGITKVLLPMVRVAGASLIYPYVVTKGILPRIPGLSSSFLQAAYIHAWWIELFGFLTFTLTKLALQKFGAYRAKLRDNLYLERRELMDMQAPESST